MWTWVAAKNKKKFGNANHVFMASNYIKFTFYNLEISILINLYILNPWTDEILSFAGAAIQVMINNFLNDVKNWLVQQICCLNERTYYPEKIPIPPEKAVSRLFT